MRRLTLAPLVALASLVAVASVAHADPGSRAEAELAYTAPATCPAREELVAEVAARLGYQPFASAGVAGSTPHSPGYLVTIVDTRYHDRWVARLRSPKGAERTFRGTRSGCAELVNAIALALTMELSPLDEAPQGTPVMQVPQGTQKPDGNPPPAVAHAPSSPGVLPREDDPFHVDDAPPARSTEREPGGALTAGVVLAGDIGRAPSPMLGPRLLLGWGRQTLRFVVDGRASRTVQSQSLDGLQVSASFVGAAAGGCIMHAPWMGCAKLAAGRFEASAASPSREAASALVMPEIGLGVAARVSQTFRFLAMAEASAPLRPIAFSVGDHAPFRMSPVAFGVSLGFAWEPVTESRPAPHSSFTTAAAR